MNAQIRMRLMLWLCSVPCGSKYADQSQIDYSILINELRPFDQLSCIVADRVINLVVKIGGSTSLPPAGTSTWPSRSEWLGVKEEKCDTTSWT